MKTMTMKTLGMISTLIFATGAIADQNQTDIRNIESLLYRYEEALNGSDIKTIMTLYAVDGVFMPQHSPSKVGETAVRSAYQQVFKTIDLQVKFDIKEILQISPDWAIARTNSGGTVRLLANNQSGAEANQELFVLQKDGSGEWKIARYAFSTTSPRRN